MKKTKKSDRFSRDFQIFQIIKFTELENSKPGKRLRGAECKRFIKACKNDIILTAEQDIQLFEILYNRYSQYLADILAGTEKRYGKIEKSKIAPYQWEVLIDFMFTGDMHSTNQDILLTTLRRSIKLEDPKPFEYLITDISYWKKAGVEEDRAKMRAVFVKEWNKYLSKRKGCLPEVISFSP